MEVDSDPAPQGHDNNHEAPQGYDNSHDNSLSNGLATSRHAEAPQAAQAAQAPKGNLQQPPRRPGKAPTTGASHLQQQPQALLQDLVTLVLKDQQAVAQGLAKEVQRYLPHCTAPARLDDASFKKVVIERGGEGH